MPELPEVETVKTHITPLLLHKKILSAKNFRPNLRIDFPENLAQILAGRIVKKISRRAKYIICYLDTQQLLILHLGMSGKIFIKDKKDFTLGKHDHFIMELEGDKIFIFNDVRRFGLLTLIKEEDLQQHKMFKNLGIEPLTEEFNATYLQEKLQGKKQNIKTSIMDQNIVVGVGNIYACEALFLAGISPHKEACLLKKQELKILVEKIKQTLAKAIEKGGSTIKDFQIVNGESGYFQHEFKVYGRENKSCHVCTNTIRNSKLAGRSSFYCAQCQK